MFFDFLHPPKSSKSKRTFESEFSPTSLFVLLKNMNQCRLASAVSGSGEVIVLRGPAALHGCKVMIWGDKARGPTWDFDRCYVQILNAAILVAHSFPDSYEVPR